QLANVLGQRWEKGPRLAAWIQEQAISRAAELPSELTIKVPEGLTPYPWQVSAAHMIARRQRVLITDEMGPQPVDTPILTDGGWSKLGDLRPGDTVYDLEGKPRRVRSIKFFGTQQVYRVTLNDRSSTLATAKHRWLVHTHNSRFHGGAPRIMTTEQLQEARIKAGFGHKTFLRQQPILEGRTSSDLPLDPYVYGVLLGDGSLGGENLSLSNPEPEIQARAAESAAALGTPSTLYKPSNGRCPTLRFHRKGALANVLEQLGARAHAADKYVHEDYLRADERTRRELLAGLLDTDGSPEPSAAAVEFCSASPRLAEDVAFLTRSLGGAAT